MSVFYEQGRYRGRVTKQAIGETKTEQPQFVLSFQVIAQYFGEDLENVAQVYERSMFRVINGNTIQYVTQDLEQLGYPHDSFRFLSPDTPNFHNFAGHEFDFVCKHETYQGKESEKWSLARDGEGFEVKPLATDKMRKLDALFGKQLKGGASTPVARPAASRTATAVDDGPPPHDAPISDEGLPF